MPVRAFISYSHDSPTHAARVLALAQRLRRDGIDAWIDQFEPAPAQGWPRWMVREVKRADFILLLCTPTYRRRFEGEETPGQGRGVTWEGQLLAALAYRKGGDHTGIIPLLWDDGDDANVPLAFSGATRHTLDNGYHGLLAQLRGVAGARPASLGTAALTTSLRTAPQTASRESTPPLKPAAALSAGLPAEGPTQCPFIAGPPIKEPAHFFGRRAQLRAIETVLAQGKQPIQILGERRTGKTSLMHRLRPLLAAPDRLVWLAAGDVMDACTLVCRIAHSLGNRAVAQLLAPGGTVVSEVALIDAFDDLLPLTLLVDEADVLTDPTREFSSNFLVACRGHCQSGRLRWISTSRQHLGRGDSNWRTSQFMNDSRQVHVGALDDSEVAELLIPLAPGQAAWVAQRAGGQVYLLQWLAQRLWLAPLPATHLDRLEDRAADELRIVFDQWWAHREAGERTLLLRCATQGPVSGLPKPQRRLARRLVGCGLLSEQNGAFSVLGSLWRDDVAERVENG